MYHAAILSAPLAFVWTILTNQINPAGFALGYIISIIILYVLDIKRYRLIGGNPIKQLFWTLVYAVHLNWQIIVSAVDVARRVLLPKMDIEPGIVPVSTQDDGQDVIISFLSAHHITITPGELVVDFDDSSDECIMYVHCLDVEAYQPTLISDQTERLKIFRRMLGRD